jgi:hypothetical protein
VTPQRSTQLRFSGRLRGRLGAAAIACAVFIVSCTHKSVDASPEGAARALVEHLRDASMDPHAFPDAHRDAYNLLATTTKRKLEARAERAGKLQGRRTSGEDMLVTSLFALRFEPRIYSSSVKEEHAEVEVRGDGKLDSAKMLCVREADPNRDGAFVWRVELEIPNAPATVKEDRLKK